jgi:hypothetical protein
MKREWSCGAVIICGFLGCLHLSAQGSSWLTNPQIESAQSFLGELGEAVYEASDLAKDAIIATGEQVPHLISYTSLSELREINDTFTTATKTYQVGSTLINDGALSAASLAITKKAADAAETLAKTAATRIAMLSGNPLLATGVGYVAGKAAGIVVEAALSSFFDWLWAWVDEILGNRQTLDDVLAAAKGEASSIANQRRAGNTHYNPTHSAHAADAFRDQSAAHAANQRTAHIDMLTQQAAQLTLQLLDQRMSGAGNIPNVSQGRGSSSGRPPGGGVQTYTMSDDEIRRTYPDGRAHDIQFYDMQGSGRWQIFRGVDSQTAENILPTYRAIASDQARPYIGYVRTYTPTSPIRVGVEFVASPQPVIRR